MTVVDTSELMRPTQRKLHAAWCELAGRPVLAPQSVARELAPLGADPTAIDGRSAAEALLHNLGPDIGARRITELRVQAWWAEMWRAPESPYRIVSLDEKQDELADRLLLAIDRRCFPTTEPGDIGQHPDARIVCESVALGAKMLLTNNLRSIDRVEVNRWAVDNGAGYGFKPEPVLYQADAAFVGWTEDRAGLERWIQAGLLACWPDDDDAPARAVVEHTLAGIAAMTQGSGGKLPEAGARLINGLEQHPDPLELVERTRRLFPSATIRTDRDHPTYPHDGRTAEATPTPQRAPEVSPTGLLAPASSGPCQFQHTT